MVYSYILLNGKCNNLVQAVPGWVAEKLECGEMLCAAAIDDAGVARAVAAFHLCEISPASAWIDFLYIDEVEDSDNLAKELLNYIFDYLESKGIMSVGTKCPSIDDVDFKEAYLTLTNCGFFPTSVVGRLLVYKVKDLANAPALKNPEMVKSLLGNAMMLKDIPAYIRNEMRAQDQFKYFDFDNPSIDSSHSMVIVDKGRFSGLVLVARTPEGNYYASCFYVIFTDYFQTIAAALIAAVMVYSIKNSDPDSYFIIENHSRDCCDGIRKMFGEPVFECRAGELITIFGTDLNEAVTEPNSGKKIIKPVTDLVSGAEFYEGSVTFDQNPKNMLFPLDKADDVIYWSIEGCQKTTMYGFFNQQSFIYGYLLYKIENGINYNVIEEQMLDRYLEHLNEWHSDAGLLPMSEMNLYGTFGRKRMSSKQISDEEICNLIKENVNYTDDTFYLIYTADRIWTNVVEILKKTDEKKLKNVVSIFSDDNPIFARFKRLSPISDMMDFENVDLMKSSFYLIDGEIAGFTQTVKVSDKAVVIHSPIMCDFCKDAGSIVSLLIGAIRGAISQMDSSAFIMLNFDNFEEGKKIATILGEGYRMAGIKNGKVLVM